MRTATCLTFMALGAILTFAVHGHPSWLNLQAAGVVIMLAALAGLLLGGRGYGWLRRRIVLRRGNYGPVVGHIDETNYPSSYAMIDPAALQSVQPAPDTDDRAAATIPDVPGGEPTDEWVVTEEEAAPPAPPAEPMVGDEYVEEK